VDLGCRHAGPVNPNPRLGKPSANRSPRLDGCDDYDGLDRAGHPSRPLDRQSAHPHDWADFKTGPAAESWIPVNDTPYRPTRIHDSAKPASTNLHDSAGLAGRRARRTSTGSVGRARSVGRAGFGRSGLGSVGRGRGSTGLGDSRARPVDRLGRSVGLAARRAQRPTALAGRRVWRGPQDYGLGRSKIRQVEVAWARSLPRSSYK
jgi:hypothetical protein